MAQFRGIPPLKGGKAVKATNREQAKSNSLILQGHFLHQKILRSAGQKRV
jgi:hypothetical protein